MGDYLSDRTAHGGDPPAPPWLARVEATSDLLVAAACLVLAAVLWEVLRGRPGPASWRAGALLGGALLVCGAASLLSAMAAWSPLAERRALAGLVAGLGLLAGAAMLPSLLPRIPPAGRSEALAIDALRRERGRLEEEVLRRTQQLAASNARLRAVMQETLHRKKNLLTVVQALARQTAKSSTDPEGFSRAFSGRLDALARADRAAQMGPDGCAADLEGLLQDQIAHVCGGAGAVGLTGPPVALTPEAGQQIALAAHELATNALKYGALRGTGGRIAISWRIAAADAGAQLVLDWRESFEPGVAAGGAPAAETRRGLGTALLMQIVPAQLGGRAVRDLSSGGLAWRLEAPMTNISPQRPDAAPEGATELAQPLRA